MQPPAPGAQPAAAPFTAAAPSPFARHAALAVAFVAFCVLAWLFHLYRSQGAGWVEPPPATRPAAATAAQPTAPLPSASQATAAAQPETLPASAPGGVTAAAAPPMEAASAAAAAETQAPVVQLTDPLANPATTPVSRCERDGRITYSDSGCAPGATGRPVEVGPDKNTVVRLKPPASAPLVIEMPTTSVPTPRTDTADTNAARLRACAALDQQLQQIEADVRQPTPVRSPEQLTAERKRVSDEYTRLRC